MPDTDREDFEHIPWSRLAEDTRPRMDRRLVAAAVVAVAVALIVGVARSVGGAGVVSTVAAPAPATSAPVPSAADTTTTVPLPQLYREADLRAVLPDEELRLAAMRAEWHVRDHFTVTGARDGTTPVQAYVEWARTYRVDGTDSSRYVVLVAYRLLAAGSEGVFERLPLQAVEIVVGRDGSGGLAIADLPRPVDPPPDARVEDWPEIAAVPAEVVARSERTLTDLGLVGEVLGGHRIEAGWRVLVRAGPPQAPAYPLALVVGT